jgi:hypothetical protein
MVNTSGFFFFLKKGTGTKIECRTVILLSFWQNESLKCWERQCWIKSVKDMILWLLLYGKQFWYKVPPHSAIKKSWLLQFCHISPMKIVLTKFHCTFSSTRTFSRLTQFSFLVTWNSSVLEHYSVITNKSMCFMRHHASLCIKMLTHHTHYHCSLHTEMFWGCYFISPCNIILPHKQAFWVPLKPTHANKCHSYPIFNAPEHLKFTVK